MAQIKRRINHIVTFKSSPFKELRMEKKETPSVEKLIEILEKKNKGKIEIKYEKDNKSMTIISKKGPIIIPGKDETKRLYVSTASINDKQWNVVAEEEAIKEVILYNYKLENRDKEWFEKSKIVCTVLQTYYDEEDGNAVFGVKYYEPYIEMD